MRVIPAVDVLGGKVVRLHQGDYNRVTVYGDDPVSVAQGFLADGCDLVHLVDLQAARSGFPSLEVVSTLKGANVPFQIGGGIRCAEDAVFAIDSGATRVVVGSVLLSGSGAIEEMVSTVGSHAVVGALDVRGGRARGSGWLDDGIALADALEVISKVGIERVLVTGIDADGTMEGPSWELLSRVRGVLPGTALIASGGVGSLDDLKALAASKIGFEAAIVGRALYEHRFTLSEAIAASS